MKKHNTIKYSLLFSILYVNNIQAQQIDQLMNDNRTNNFTILNKKCGNNNHDRDPYFYQHPHIQDAPDMTRYYIQYCKGNVCQMGERPPIKEPFPIKHIVDKNGGKVNVGDYHPPLFIQQPGGMPTHGTIPPSSPAPIPPSTGKPNNGGTPLPSPYPITPTENDLYVSINGNDVNPGTKDKPFKTISKAASVARPSTTVHVGQGVYKENVRTNPSGTSTGRIVYVSEIKWGAQIIGSGTESAWFNKGNYVDIIGFDISGTGRLGIRNDGSHTLIQGNHVHDLKITGGCTGSGGAGIVNANYSGSNGDIVGNVVHDIGIPGECGRVQGIYSSNKGGKIQNNIVYRSSGYGIHLWHAAKDVLISNNTVLANGSAVRGGGIMIGNGDSPGGILLENTTVANNIVVNNPRDGIIEYCSGGPNCLGKNNVVINNLVYGSLTNVKMRTGKEIGTIVADPQFVGYGTVGVLNDYRLKNTSPAINKGISQYSPAYDIDNKERTQNAIDLGAYESF